MEREGYVRAIAPVDLAKKDDIKDCVRAIKKNATHVDIVINNAGVVKGLSWTDLSYDDFHHALCVNTLAYYAMAKAFLPSMCAASLV